MIGVDEVGRGSWAGPLLVVAARTKSDLPKGLKDSKLLTKTRRKTLYTALISTCDYGEGWVTPLEIDKLGLGRALYLAGRRALTNLQADVDEPIILDGIYNYLPRQFTNVRYYPRADNKEPIVSAASIMAKVKRDNHMQEVAIKHPDYGFSQHVGYGTKMHSQALKLAGPIVGVHRFCFKPVAESARHDNN